MGKYLIEITDTAKNHFHLHKKSGNKADIRKIETLVAELEEHPYTGIGKPEQLKYELTGFWSRRINKKDRLVYVVSENLMKVEIMSAMGHYIKI
jgi:toxin YoeB